jgi:two-component system sensor histidine kinase KdpD
MFFSSSRISTRSGRGAGLGEDGSSLTSLAYLLARASGGAISEIGRRVRFLGITMLCMSTSSTSRAADFLELVERSKRGRLKIYLGFAAGVGKTYRLLEEAQALRRRGVDVVIGAIETHGRAETAALLEGLETVPLRAFSYRGLTLTEMDVGAVIARRPQVVLIDELAHTNVPGSKHNKRYQDVAAVLDQGINVIGAFNVQHLESLNDVVARVTAVRVRETVPDSFLKQADQVVTLDLDVEDLLERLRAGKIYPPDKIALSLQNFFQTKNLATLRELALREVAESLDRSGGATAASGLLPKRGSSGKLMVCLSSNPPRGRTLLRRGSRLSGRLNTDWYVVYVETAQEAPHRIDAAAQRQLIANIELAKELGAEFVRLRGDDPVEALLTFAREQGVSDVVIGRGEDSLLTRLAGRSFTRRMVDQAEGIDLHIVSFGDSATVEPSAGESQ